MRSTSTSIQRPSRTGSRHVDSKTQPSRRSHASSTAPSRSTRSALSRTTRSRRCSASSSIRYPPPTVTASGRSPSTGSSPPRASGSGQPALAVRGGLSRSETGVRLLRLVRLLVHAGVVPARRLVDGVATPVLAVLVLPGANGDDDARAVAGADDHMLHPGRTVDEVPLPQRPLLPLGDQQGRAVHDEEVLLIGLPVIHGHRVPRAEDEQIDADLLELRLPLEQAEQAAHAAVVPSRLAGVD